MKRFFALLCLVLALAACGRAEERQPINRDPQLDSLFMNLVLAETPAQAQAIEAQIWQRLNDSGSPTVNVLMSRAANAEAQGRPEQAFIFLEEAAKLEPDFAEAYFRRAALLASSGDYDAAIEQIEATLEREPRHFGALTVLGIIYEQAGQMRAAAEAYRRATAIHPHYEQAKQGLARTRPQVEGQDI